MIILSGTFTATGESDVINIAGEYDLSISGFGNATVDLERSFDGVNYNPVESFTADAEKTGKNKGSCFYKFNCTAWTSGTIVYAISI